jgi:hypothetical protein
VSAIGTRADRFERCIEERGYERVREESRRHLELSIWALTIYGTQGASISGCVREHFPEALKGELRMLAKAVTRASVKAWDARPHRVRSTTMRRLSRMVAARDGTGFYGPQP